MTYGYLDESGAPGFAINAAEYLVVSLVLFDTKEAAGKCAEEIGRLREELKLQENYEFHRSRNTSRSKEGFVKLMSRSDFRFITIAIKKTRVKSHASYPAIARLLAHELGDRFSELRIEMDSNPVLHSEIKKALRVQRLHHIRVKQVKSHTNNLIQLADYVVNLSAQKAKGTPRAAEQFRPIAKKQLVFLEVAD
jgi:hypothetical protein